MSSLMKLHGGHSCILRHGRASCQTLVRSLDRNMTNSKVDLDTGIQGESPLYLRRTMEAMCRVESIRVAGVTFDGRQEVLKKLHHRQAVMLIRQPWNVHDEKAVSVHTLSGSLIGWVPRTDNDRFQSQDLAFGRIDYVGAAPGSDILGARVVVQPALMPSHVSPFSWQLLPARSGTGPVGASAASASPGNRLRESVEPREWLRLSKDAERLSRGLCEVTGASRAASPLELVPVWMYNDDKMIVSLQRLSLVCEEVALALRALDLPTGSMERAIALSALRSINHWELHEVEEHFRAVAAQRALLLREAWTVQLMDK